MTSLEKTLYDQIAPSAIQIQYLKQDYDSGKIKLDPDFQRSDDVWEPHEQSYLIESILLGLPIPPLYEMVTADRVREIVDGVQRLTAVFGYVSGDFKLQAAGGLQELKDLDGCFFNDLSPDLQDRILSYNLYIYKLPRDTPRWGETIRYVMFDRLNRGHQVTYVERLMAPAGKGRDLLRDLAEKLKEIWDPDLSRTQARIKSKERRADLVSDTAFCVMALLLEWHNTPEGGEELGFGDFLLRTGGNAYSEAWFGEVLKFLNNCDDTTHRDVRMAFHKGVDIIRDVFGENALERVRKDAKRHSTNRVSGIVQFYGTRIRREPVEWWKEHRGAVVHLYGELCESPNFSIERRKLSALLREYAAGLQAIKS